MPDTIVDRFNRQADPWNRPHSKPSRTTSLDEPRRSGGIFDYDGKQEKLEEVTRELEDPNVWNDAERAQSLNKERAALDKSLTAKREVIEGVSEAGELLEMAVEEDDPETLTSVEADLLALERKIGALEFQRMFSGDMDDRPCFIDIQAGSGGTEAQDWAEMLLRMYLRWAEARGWDAEI